MTERTNAQAPTVRGFWCDTPGFRKLLNDLRDGDGTVEEAAVTRFWNGILSRLFPYDGSERETFFVGPEAYVNPNTQERVDLLVVRITVNNEEIPIFAVEVKGTTPRSDGAWKDPYEQLRRYLTGLKLKYPQLREMYGAVAAGALSSDLALGAIVPDWQP